MNFLCGLDLNPRQLDEWNERSHWACLYKQCQYFLGSKELQPFIGGGKFFDKIWTIFFCVGATKEIFERFFWQRERNDCCSAAIKKLAPFSSRVNPPPTSLPVLANWLPVGVAFLESCFLSESSNGPLGAPEIVSTGFSPCGQEATGQQSGPIRCISPT